MNICDVFGIVQQSLQEASLSRSLMRLMESRGHFPVVNLIGSFASMILTFLRSGVTVGEICKDEDLSVKMRRHVVGNLSW